jgi:hypothetical protein
VATTRRFPAPSVVSALEELDPASRALLDLSLRQDLDDELIAQVVQADVDVLHATRAEAVRLVTAGVDLAPEDELEYVREALEHLSTPELLAPSEHTREEIDELEHLLELEPAPEPTLEPEPEPEPARPEPLEPDIEPRRLWGRIDLWLVAILALATFVRVWQLTAVGYNSDEAVYSGQGAALAGDPDLSPLFPAFRAHPLLFQMFLSFGYQLDIAELFGRLLSAAIGVATVYVVYRIGLKLYGRKVGYVAALLFALMPYHVVVTRQVLLDGPMTLLAMLTLLALVHYAAEQRAGWLLAAGACMGLTMLTKESSIVLLGSVYAFLALTPSIKLRPKLLIGSGLLVVGMFLIHPLSLSLAGHTKTGGNYLAWQLFRRPNHEWTFYPATVPVAIGLLVVLLAIAGLWWMRSQKSWRETLLLCWIAVPVAFFQLWPVKGFQYLLPIAAAVALLAARTMVALPAIAKAREGKSKRPVWNDAWRQLTRPRAGAVVIGVVALSLFVPTWQKIQPAKGDTFLAGSGGVPGGREAGRWLEEHTPKGAQLMTIGPSMANIVQFYGHRRAFGLSVSPNPLNRNPSYEPLMNPDQSIRRNDLQYIVWDSFSADRSKFFSDSLKRYTERYHGRLVWEKTVPGDGGKPTPIIQIFEVRP